MISVTWEGGRVRGGADFKRISRRIAERGLEQTLNELVEVRLLLAAAELGLGRATAGKTEPRAEPGVGP